MSAEGQNGEEEGSAPSKQRELDQIAKKGQKEFERLKDLPSEEQESVSQRTQEEFTDLERQHRKEELRGKQQDREERKRYADLIFKLICYWLIAVFGLLLVQGQDWFHFELSNGVLLAVVGSTTANVLGIFWLVANYLFPRNDGQ